MIRLGTFNIHYYQNARHTKRIEQDVNQTLHHYQPHVIGFQEVSEEDLFQNSIDGLNYKDSLDYDGFGLAVSIASRFKVLSVHRSNVPHRRVVIVNQVETLDGSHRFAIVCCHLDPRTETKRVAQINAIVSFVKSLGFEDHVLLGDMNCVRTSDYTPSHLDSITKFRAKNYVEAPLDDVVNYLDDKNYIDAYRYKIWSDDYDALKKSTYKESLKDDKYSINFDRRWKIATCWAGTRIDHFWISSSLAEKLDIVEYNVCKEEISDHRMVLLDVKFKDSKLA